MCLLGTDIGHQKSYVSWVHRSVGQLGRLARGKFLMGRLGRIPTALSAFKLADELVVWGGGDVMFDIKYTRRPKEGSNMIAAIEGKSLAIEGRPSAGDQEE
jgi:hypothetical protein